MDLENENHNNKRQQTTGPTTTTITKTSIHRYQINSLITITINPEYESIVPPLSEEEYEALKKSIKENGLCLPIFITEYGVILDGHHRYKICLELGIEPKFEIKRFDNKLDEIEFVIDINLTRRQLTPFQRVELAFELEKVESEKAKLRSLQNLKNVSQKLSSGSMGHIDNLSEDQGRTRAIVSKKAGISQGTYERGRKIIQNGSEEQKKKLRKGKSTINKECNKIKKDQKKEELKSIKTNIELSPENCKLFCNDFTQIDSETIPDNSIYLIFTDPPYGEQYLYLYEDLARLAVTVLKPGGSLVFYAGHIILNKILRIMDDSSSNLKYWWTLAVKHNGAKQRVHARSVFAEWKPLIWYTKGQKPTNILDTMFDHIESSPPDKISYEWTQSQEEPEHIIRYLTVENQIGLDPMMGSGTTGIAALKLNRKFIGIEINSERFETAEANIKKSISSNNNSISNKEESNGDEK